MSAGRGGTTHYLDKDEIREVPRRCHTCAYIGLYSIKKTTSTVPVLHCLWSMVRQLFGGKVIHTHLSVFLIRDAVSFQ